MSKRNILGQVLEMKGTLLLEADVYKNAQTPASSATTSVEQVAKAGGTGKLETPSGAGEPETAATSVTTSAEQVAQASGADKPETWQDKLWRVAQASGADDAEMRVFFKEHGLEIAADE